MVASPSKPAVMGPSLTDILRRVYIPSPRSSVNLAPGMHWATDEYILEEPENGFRVACDLELLRDLHLNLLLRSES